MSITCALALTVAMATPAVALAQIPNPSPAQLVNAVALNCQFTTMSTGTWKDGVAESSSRPAKLTVGFKAIDTEAGTAVATVSGARSHITVRVSGNYLHLMQMEPFGALYVTTVFATATKSGRLQASHTRHEFTPVSVPGLTSRPEMYVGDCLVTGK